MSEQKAYKFSFSSVLKIIFVLLIVGVFIFLKKNNLLQPEKVAETLQQSGHNLALWLLVIGTVRILGFLPHMTIVAAAVILYPDRFWLDYGIAMFTIWSSSTITFYISKIYKLPKFFLKKVQKYYDYITEKLNKYGFWFIFFFSVFPVLNFDIVTYVVSNSKVSYLKFIVANTLGHAIFYALVIWFANLFL